MLAFTHARLLTSMEKQLLPQALKCRVSNILDGVILSILNDFMDDFGFEFKKWFHD